MKYHNKKVIYDDILFDSKREMKRYEELKLLERAGMIKDLQRQVKFELQPSFKIGKNTIRAIHYIADFVYYEKDNMVVEDSKGFRTKDYILKAKMFAYKYGVEIREV